MRRSDTLNREADALCKAAALLIDEAVRKRLLARAIADVEKGPGWTGNSPPRPRPANTR